MSLLKKLKNLGKKQSSGQTLGSSSSQNQGQRGHHLGGENTRHVPSDAKDAAKLAAERRFAAEQEKKAQDDVRRRERQMKIEEERLLRQQMGEMSIQEQQEYERKLKEQEKESNNETQNVKKKLNPVLYTSPLLAEGLIAGPANEIFQQIADIIAESNDLESEKKQELAVRLFHTANSSDTKEKALTRIRKMIQMICENPEEKKYREAKRQHPLYADTVIPAIGAELFLLLIGFEIAEVPEKGQVIRLIEGTEIDLLPAYLEILENPQTPLELSVYRHAKIYFLADNAKVEPIQVPEWAYKLSATEVAALQKEREREAEWWMTVCSKRRRTTSTPFKVSVIRVRFPNSAILEAMFAVDEGINDVINYIATLLGYPPESIVLNEAVGNKFDINSTESIGEAKLVPYALLHFKFTNEAKNYSFPNKDHIKICEQARKKMDFIGIDIADYKF